MIYNDQLFDFMGHQCPILSAPIPEKKCFGIRRVIFKIQKEYDYFGQVIHSYKVGEKSRFEEYQFIHARENVKVNWERQLEYERDCYAFRLSTFRKPYPRVIFTVIPSPKGKLRGDPYQKFVPSKHLIKLVEEHMVHPDEEVREMIKSLTFTFGRLRTDAENRRQHLANMITDQVEGLITNLAKRSFIVKNPVRITTNGRFTPDICSELVRRLGLDSLNPYPVLRVLYEELIDFMSVPRQRNWGQIVFENSDLTLILKEEPFVFPDLDKIETDDKWLTT